MKKRPRKRKRRSRPARRRRLKLLTAPKLAHLKWLRHAFTTRQPEEFHLGYAAAPKAALVVRNRQALREALNHKTGWQLVTLRQRHTDIVRLLTGPEPGKLPGAEREPDGAVKLPGDAAATDQPGLLLAVQVADCLPVLLVDVEQRVVAAVHAGWRGTLASIVAKAAGRLRQEFGSKPSKLLAAVGPGIHRCCYEVGPDVASAFDGRFPYGDKLLRRTDPSPSEVHWQQPLPGSPGAEPRPRPGATSPRGETFQLDLVEATRRQLLEAGLSRANLWVSPECTACRTDRFFSHRAEQGRTGRMMGVVGIVQR